MEKSINEIPIHINVSDIGNKCLTHISKNIEIVSALYHSLTNYDLENRMPLETNSIPIRIGHEEHHTEINKNDALDWLFRKAFEDFILGLTESLVEAYKCLKLRTLSIERKGKPFTSEKDLYETVDKIKKSADKAYFPVLLTHIEKELNYPLPLSKEILSVNKVRNCLVHRNSIVSDQDLNDNYRLELYYLDFVTYVEKDGEMVELTFDLKKQLISTTKMELRMLPKTVYYKNQTKITIDQNIFNGVAHTCWYFIHCLYAAIREIIPQKA